MFRLLLLALAIWVFYRMRHNLRSLGGPGASRRVPPQSQERDPWETLGLTRGASQEEIRRAFRRRMAEYHPDKVRDLGSELRELAEQRAREITRAYTALTRD